MKKAGRALGRVRDLDVAIELIGGARTIDPGSGGARGGGTPPDCQQAIDCPSAARQRVRRPAVGGRDERRGPPAKGPLAYRPSRRPGVRRSDPDALRDHAAALRQAIDHGSGVYFPKRAHGVRIDAKKLRYILEMTNDPEAVAPDGLKTLKKSQELLGSLHDREVLKERFTRLVEADKNDSSVETALAAIDAECQRLFAAYAAAGRPSWTSAMPSRASRPRPSRRAVRPMSLLRIASVALPVAALLAARAGVPRLPGPNETRPGR